jgi:hypothetical protein
MSPSAAHDNFFLQLLRREQLHRHLSSCPFSEVEVGGGTLQKGGGEWRRRVGVSEKERALVLRTKVARAAARSAVGVSLWHSIKNF